LNDNLASSATAIILHTAIRGRSNTWETHAISRLEEARGLSEAISLDIAHAEVITLKKIHPATLFGSGVVTRLKGMVQSLCADLVVIDGGVTPVQQRNLEHHLAAKVIDRTGLILEIFGERARTKEGQLQVELAHLLYQRSRLVRSWTHLERQRGGFGFLGGPGETQIEIDRRLIDIRIAKINKNLDKVKRMRELHRKARKRVPYPIVALVGYTNAGKSTLFNSLTQAEALTQDKLFSTLDPTMRAVSLASGRRIIISDTVGFISDLPHELIAAFRATLEEVIDADLIVHVRDIAIPETDIQCRDVANVLKQMDVPRSADQPIIEVLNKIDLLSAEKLDQHIELSTRNDWKVPLSALNGSGIQRLLDRIDEIFAIKRATLGVSVPCEDGETLAWLYRRGEVVERHNGEEKIYLKVLLDSEDIARLHKRYSIDLL